MTPESKLTTTETEHVARLARLELTPEEISRYQAELNEVLAVVESLNEVDTTTLGVTAQVSGLQNVTRPDAVGAELTKADSLANAPQTDGDHFVVPGVL